MFYKQQHEENGLTSHFIEDLKKYARREEKTIWDKIVLGIYNLEAQEKLLNISKLTVDEAIESIKIRIMCEVEGKLQTVVTKKRECKVINCSLLSKT